MKIRILTIILLCLLISGCGKQLGKQLTEIEKVDTEILLLKIEDFKYIPEYEKDGVRYSKHTEKDYLGATSTRIIIQKDGGYFQSIGDGDKAKELTYTILPPLATSTK